MASTLTYADFAELTLVRLGGARLAPPRSGPTDSTLTINAHIEGDGLGMTVEIIAMVHEPGNIDAAQFRGEIAYHANFYGPVLAEQTPDVIGLIWPYLRAGLVEHATRFGSSIAVPIETPRPPTN